MSGEEALLRMLQKMLPKQAPTLAQGVCSVLRPQTGSGSAVFLREKRGIRGLTQGFRAASGARPAASGRGSVSLLRGRCACTLPYDATLYHCAVMSFWAYAPVTQSRT